MKTVLSFKMNVVKLILVYMFVWMANRAFFSAATVSASAETLPDYSAFSNLLQSRMKRDDHYHMKCHQSGTGNSMVIRVIVRSKRIYVSGMFSFFAVPILMGDIMIDFMNMVSTITFWSFSSRIFEFSHHFRLMLWLM